MAVYFYSNLELVFLERKIYTYTHTHTHTHAHTHTHTHTHIYIKAECRMYFSMFMTIY